MSIGLAAAHPASQYARQFLKLVLLTGGILALAFWFSPLVLMDGDGASAWRGFVVDSPANAAATTAPCDKGSVTDAAAIGARDLVDASATASAAAFDARAVQFGGKPLCWWSGDHGGYGWDDDASRDRRRKKRKHSGQRRGGVLMFGSGCAGCVAGEWCSFEIEIRPPAKWVFAATEAFVDFLIVELWGPSIAYADVKRIGSDSKRWKVSYRVWDAGEYTVTVISGCTNLNYTAKFAKQGVEPFANWTLTVAHPFANLPNSRYSSQLPAESSPTPGIGAGNGGKQGHPGGDVERVLAERTGRVQGGAEKGAEGGKDGGKKGGWRVERRGGKGGIGWRKQRRSGMKHHAIRLFLAGGSTWTMPTGDVATFVAC
ncbi:unnamed protein product [Closterium sp. Yama58-4]|nr:unnamed protein product [Closterium sp. Yama58-4]